MDDPVLERARLLLAAANNENAAMRSVMGSDRAAASAPEDVIDALPEIIVATVTSPKSVRSVVSDSKPIESDEKQIVNKQTNQNKGEADKKGTVKEKVKENVKEKEREKAPESSDLCDDPILARARLFIAAANSQNAPSSNPQQIGSLSIDIPTSSKNSPTSSSSKPNSSHTGHTGAAYDSPMRSILKKGEQMNLKCCVIKGSSLVNTSADVRSYLKVGGIAVIDGVSYQLSNSVTEWSANRIALDQDWPSDTNFEAILSLDSSVKRSPTKKKNVAVPVSASDIQGAVCQLDEFLSSKLLRPSSNKSKSMARKGSKTRSKYDSKSPLTRTDEFENNENKSIYSLNSTNNTRNTGYSGNTGTGYMGAKISTEEDSIESSRQLALNRVTEKIREEKELAKIENQNKVQSQLVAQIVTERKTAELHMKTIERIAQRKDVERANKQRLQQLEEEQRVAEEVSHSKLDERIQKMDELRKKTLGRMRAAKVKVQEEEQRKERDMADRLRAMGLESGRAVSVPLQFNDNVQSSYYNSRIAKNAGTLRESLSAGDLTEMRSTSGRSNGTLPPIRQDNGHNTQNKNSAQNTRTQTTNNTQDRRNTTGAESTQHTQNTQDRQQDASRSPTKRREKLSKIGSSSRIPAPVKLTKNANTKTVSVFTPGGSTAFKGKVTPAANGEWTEDYQNVIALVTGDIGGDDSDDDRDDGNDSTGRGDDRNVLEDSLDDNSFGIFPTSPLRKKEKGSEKLNGREQGELMEPLELSPPKYRNIHDSLGHKQDNGQPTQHAQYADNRQHTQHSPGPEQSLSSKNASGKSNKDRSSKNRSVTHDQYGNEDSDGDRSRVSELSADDSAAYEGSPSKGGGGDGAVGGAVGEKRKKKSKPWRALKPIALKPFIELPVTD